MVLKQQAGNISSPNFPNDYPSDFNCSWQIEVPQDRLVTFTVVAFDMDAGDQLSVSVSNGCL